MRSGVDVDILTPERRDRQDLKWMTTLSRSQSTFSSSSLEKKTPSSTHIYPIHRREFKLDSSGHFSTELTMSSGSGIFFALGLSISAPLDL